MNGIAKWFFALIFSFLITAYLIPIFISLAQRMKFLDEPDGNIKKHANPTPYMGGLAVYFGFLCGIALTLPLYNHIVFLVIGVTLLLFIGLIDDLLVMKPYQKFFGQCLAALVFLKGGFYLKERFFSVFWHIPISFLWIVSVINAFNLIDVMDGLTATVAIMAASTFLCLAYFFGQPEVVILLSSFIGACVAFLWYNRPHAQIYLGDAGALFVGGFLSTVPFLLNWSAYSDYGYLSSIVILAIPLLELITLIAVRTYKHIPFYRGSRDHFSCYMQDNGWSKKQILAYIFSMSVVIGATSFLFATNIIQFNQMAMMAVPFLGVWLISLFI